MAILSAQELFSDNQAITGDAASTNVYDRLSPGAWVHAGGRAIVDDMGNSHIPLFFQVTQDFNNLTNLQIRFEQDSTDGFGSPTIIHSETIPAANLVAGRKFAVRCVPHDVTERYLRFFYNVTGTNPSQGRVTAGFARQEDSWGTR